MIQKKVCLLGSFAVGKTSLVRRFVLSLFDERYHTTIGVRVDKKDLQVDGRELRLLIWDIHGEDELQHIRSAHLRGSAGYFLVADGTRPATVELAAELAARARAELGPVPFLLLLNKRDLEAEWEVSPEDLRSLEADGWPILETSAKTGAGVERAFEELGRRLLAEGGA